MIFICTRDSNISLQEQKFNFRSIIMLKYKVIWNQRGGIQVLQFVIVGLGNFGFNVANTLEKDGYEVLAIDEDEEKVQESANSLKHVVQADATVQDVLKSLGVGNFDVGIVSVGTDIQASILISLLLKELGTKKVISKAQNPLHGKVLERIGVDTVIYPERDTAIRLARQLELPYMIEQVPLAKEYSIYKLKVLPGFINKSLNELMLNKKYGVNVVLVKRGEDIIFPSADTVISQSDSLIVVATQDDLKIMESEAGK